MKQRKENPPSFIAVMMSSKKTMKATPKHDETVNPDDPRINIGLNTIPEPGGFEHDAVFDPGDPPEITSREKDRLFGCVDDDVLVRFYPHYIGTTPEMSSTRRFDDKIGLIGSKTVKKKLLKCQKLQLDVLQVISWVILYWQWQNQRL
jgi:hypothetical protein